MDWQLTCRVCLESGDMVSLFDWDENKQQLSDKYAYCCGLTVTSSDSLPTLICLNCVDKLTVAYQFKQQCISSNETLKDCLEEFKKTSSALPPVSSKAMETITLKKENGVLVQYEVPIDDDADGYWPRSDIVNSYEQALVPRKRRSRKQLKEQNNKGKFSRLYKEKTKEEDPESLPDNDTISIKEEQDIETYDDYAAIEDSDDPDFKPEEEHFDQEEYLDQDECFDQEPDFVPEEKPTAKKRGRPRKKGPPKKIKKEIEDNGEDMLLKETIMAFSEPIPDHILNPKPKKKYPPKKKMRGDRVYTCETCGSSFTSNTTLQTHIRRHLGIKPFVCSVCGFAFVVKLELRRHMFKHTGQRPYKCSACERCFADWGSRQKHESVCSYATGCRLGLKRHMIRHTGVKPYKCRLCERCFYAPGDRRRHEKSHTGERPYQCSVCMKTFTYSGVLANHMLTHTGEKKFSCDKCERKFTKAHHLKYHNKIHHKEVFFEQQLEQEARKAKRQVGVVGHIVDGQLKIIETEESEVCEYEGLDVVEEEVETECAVYNLDST